MKTTVVIADPLFSRVKSLARRRGQSMRALVEEGLRRVLDEQDSPPRYRLPDRSAGVDRGRNPLDGWSWQDLRDEIYRGR